MDLGEKRGRDMCDSTLAGVVPGVSESLRLVSPSFVSENMARESNSFPDR